MIGPRKKTIAIGVVAMLGLVTLPFAWDFLKLTRKAPSLVAPEHRVTRVIIDKAARRMTLDRDGTARGIYKVSLGSDPIGHKGQEGDGRTPEGTYRIDFKNPTSKFHLALRISYPDDGDRARAKKLGVAPGGDIMIHGLPNGISWLGNLLLGRDWTDGCVAVTNTQIEEIWSLVDVGTPVEIRP